MLNVPDICGTKLKRSRTTRIIQKDTMTVSDVLLFTTFLLTSFHSNAFVAVQPLLTSKSSVGNDNQLKATASWQDIERMMGPPFQTPTPSNIDSVLEPDKPHFSSERPTLFRERHGWCPYSERVWLTVELLDMKYDTIRIDNTGGGRPSYYGGQTPQMRWSDGRTQGESYDLVRALDGMQKDNNPLFSHDSQVNHIVGQFQSVFPRARPSSRAAYLFQFNGEPLWRRTFEETLQKTNDLLGETAASGPFFCGGTVTAADIAWAPFLERYRYQLPCLHFGLHPDDASTYPHLAAWYDAMQTLPAYACRVQGDASSWRKVLTMAGFGNAGLPPTIAGNMEDLALAEMKAAKSCIRMDIWEQYAANRPYIADTPQREAALIMTRNRNNILADVQKRGEREGLPEDRYELDTALRELIIMLHSNQETRDSPHVGNLARFLDERMCVPRDMGAMTAATIKHIALTLE